MKHFIFTFFIVFMHIFRLSGQTYIPGDVYFGDHGYIEYHAGNMPVVISEPHGGYLTPSTIPDRTCSGSVTQGDAYTEELAYELNDAIHALTGCYPHIIMNKLDRKKLDANDDYTTGACGNPLAEVAWQEFHAFIDSSEAYIVKTFTKGFYIDLHGQSHTKERIELGYLLYTNELQMSDSILNTIKYINYSSIRNLAKHNIDSLTHAQLLRGPYSFGSLLYDKGYPAVPSLTDPYPQTGDPYFTGGYNVAHHSSYQGGTIDGVQAECNYNIRANLSVRLKFVDSLAIVIRDYLELHYFQNYSQQPCINASIGEIEQDQFLVFPNPAYRKVFVEVPAAYSSLTLINSAGNIVKEFEGASQGKQEINISGFPDGIYLFLMDFPDGRTINKKLLIMDDNIQYY